MLHGEVGAGQSVACLHTTTLCGKASQLDLQYLSQFIIKTTGIGHQRQLQLKLNIVLIMVAFMPEVVGFCLQENPACWQHFWERWSNKVAIAG